MAMKLRGADISSCKPGMMFADNGFLGYWTAPGTRVGASALTHGAVQSFQLRCTQQCVLTVGLWASTAVEIQFPIQEQHD